MLDLTWASLNAENLLGLFQVNIVISDGEEIKFGLIIFMVTFSIFCICLVAESL